MPNQAEAQEIFNKVATHLLTQGKRSVASDGSCMYRGPEGTKCAIGCLIEDDEYHPLLEGKGAYGLFYDVNSNKEDVNNPEAIASYPSDGKGKFILGRIGTANEGQSVYIDKVFMRLSPHVVMLDDLQRIHDAGDCPNWYGILKEYADKRGFTFPVVAAR